MRTRQAAPAVLTTQTLIVADGLCPRIGELVPGALHELVALGASQDPLRAVGAELVRRRRQGQPVDTLHLVAHGRRGSVQIGGQWINAASLIAHADQLALWQVGTIALWSCEVGGDRGFVALLEELTGAEVLASNETIHGGADQNWRLNKNNLTPEPELTQPFSKALITAWAHSLAEVSFSPSVLYNVSATTTSTVTLGLLEAGASIAQDDPVLGEAGTGNTLFDSVSTDLLVRIVLSDGTTIIQGEIQRRITTGSTLEALVFFEDVDGDGTVVQGGEPGGRNFVIVRSGFESNFAAGNTESTNSAPVKELVDALNLFLAESAEPITVAVLGGTISEGSTAYCLVNLSSPAGSPTTLTLQTTLQTAEAEDFTAEPTAYYLSGTTRISLTVTAGGGGFQVVIPAGVTTIYVGYATTQDPSFESADAALEAFQVTASIPDGTGGTASASGTVTINDSGQGLVYTIDPTTGLPIVDSTASPDDDRTITVTGGTYNENSPRAVFSISATDGLPITLDVQDAADTGKQPTGDAEGGSPDSLNNAPIYYSIDGGATWDLYTGTFNAGSVPVLVAVDITAEQDDVFEGEEQLKLIVTSGSITSSAYASIKDDGTGAITAPIDDTSTDITDPAADIIGVTKDDDRSLSVTGGTYNENSPRAVFSISATDGLPITLDVQDAADTGKQPTGDAEGGSPDSLNNAPIYYSIDGGATWDLYTGTFNAGSVPVLVAVDITAEQDDVFEGEEQLKLIVTSGSITSSAYASIKDDGTGAITAPIDDTSTDITDPAADIIGVTKDDDRSLSVTGGTYNENSPRAVFSISATDGLPITLDVQDAADTGKQPTGDAEGGSPDSLNNAPIYYSIDGGATWDLYTGTFNAGSVPVLVAVDITAEQDDVFEGEEQLKLIVTSGSITSSAYASIKDDGTGAITAPIDDTSTDITDPAADIIGVTKDDDRSLSVTGGTYNENSPRAVFSISATDGLPITLDVQDAADTGKQPTGDAEGGSPDSLNNAPIYYSIDGGATWDLYTGTFNAGSVPVLVAVDITAEQDDVFEGEEQLKLIVTSGSITSSAYASIKDDGTGAITAPIDDTSTDITDPAADIGGTKDDDRSLSIADITVNEASDFAVFTVTGAAGQTISLGLANGTATGDGGDYGSAAAGSDLQYWDGDSWETYTNGSSVALNSNGKLLVRTAIVNDTTPDNNETFRLNAFNTGGDAFTGTATIKDDGTGTRFTAGNPTGDNPATVAGPLDDDRTISVNSFLVNENSPYAVFTVKGAGNQAVSLTLGNGTALTGSDFGPGLEIYDSVTGQWSSYTPGQSFNLDDSGIQLVRTRLIDDGVFENRETFLLTATSSGGVTASGTATIADDGTGIIFRRDGSSNDVATKDNDASVQNFSGDIPQALCIEQLFADQGKPGLISFLSDGSTTADQIASDSGFFG